MTGNLSLGLFINKSSISSRREPCDLQAKGRASSKLEDEMRRTEADESEDPSTIAEIRAKHDEIVECLEV
jgi:hypothetical protein